ARSPVGSRSSTTVAGCTPASTTPARSRSRKLSNTARSRLKNTLIRPKPLDQLSTTCGQAQNGGGSGSGGLWWVRRCWNSFHVGVKVWTGEGVRRSHSSRVGGGGLLRIVQGVVRGSNWVWGGVVGWVMDFLMGSR